MDLIALQKSINETNEEAKQRDSIVNLGSVQSSINDRVSESVCVQNTINS